MEVSDHDRKLEELANTVNISNDNVHSLLDELGQRYEKQKKVQLTLISTQLNMIDEQDRILDDLKTKLMNLEEKVIFPNHISNMGDRMSDINEQNARKLNLKIEGIAVAHDETPKMILDYIKKEVKRLDLDIPDQKFDYAKRIGLKFYKHGMMQQSIILKLNCSLARNKIYINRNNFNFSIHVDLTSSRQALLNFAKEEISNDENKKACRVVDTVFADLNGTIHLKAKTGRAYGFSSEAEFAKLVTWLDKGN